MTRTLIIVGLLLSMAKPSFSQSADYKIFRSVCEQLILREKNFLLKEKYKDVIDKDIFPVIDPKTGETRIICTDSSKAETRQFLGDFTPEQQFAIMTMDSAVRYVLADTVCIIDSLSFFTQPLEYEDGIVFHTEHCGGKVIVVIKKTVAICL